MIFKKLNFKFSRYDRPTAKYRCGEQCSSSCTLGPSDAGVCSGSTECVPRREDNRWNCARTGKACERGPLPDGRCCTPIHCIPQKNYRSFRKTGVFWGMAISFAVLVLLTTCNIESAFFSPGPLSPQHAIIENMECQQCHKDNHQDKNFSSLLLNNLPAEGCIECHAFAGQATLPHNNPALQSTETQSCNGCHTEHHGASGSLKPSSQQCSDCHAPHIKDITSGHKPSFNIDKTLSRVNFEHEKHFKKYFPKAETTTLQNISCKQCHNTETQQVNKGLQQQVCSQCHASDVSAEKNLAEFISIPLIDTETLLNKKIHIGEWPEDMDDAFFSELTLAYLAAQPKLQAVVKKVKDEEIDLSDLSELSNAQLQQVQALLLGFKQYLYKMKNNPLAIISEKKAAPIALQTEKLAQVINHIFPSLDSEIEALNKGQVFFTKNTQLKPNAFNSDNWTLSTNKISMQALGHEDPFVLQWFKSLQQAKGQRLTTTASKQLFSQEQGMCVKCHNISATKLPTFYNVDTHKHLKFDHKPHLNALNNSCTDCHGDTQNYQSSLNTDNCFSCHAKQEALSDCKVCHAYHPQPVK